MILFRHRVPVTRGHRATVDRTVDLLLPGHPGRFLFLRRRLLLFQEPWFPARQWTLPLARSRRSARPAPARSLPAAIREPPPTRPASHETVFAWQAPVLANSVSGPMLLRPQPSAHPDFGDADGRDLAVLDPAAGREDEGQPAALPVRTKGCAQSRLRRGQPERGETDGAGQRDGGGENEVFAGPPTMRAWRSLLFEKPGR